MRRKIKTNLVLLSLLLVLIIGHDDIVVKGVEESEWLWVDSDDNTYTEWTEVGTIPYLDAQDQPTNYGYVTSSSQGKKWGVFGFDDASGAPISVDIIISIYESTDEIISIYLSNSTYEAVITFTGTGTWGWQFSTVDDSAYPLSDMFPSLAEINGAIAYVSGISIGGSGVVNLDAIRLGITFEGGGEDNSVNPNNPNTDHDPIVQKPPFWFSTEFAWLVWTLLWGGMGIILGGAVLYYFFKKLFSMFN